MNNGELGILISGKIDVSKTISQINSDLQELTKKVQSLSLNIDVSDLTKDVKREVDAMTKQLRSSSGGISSAMKVDAKDIQKHYADIYDDIDRIVKKYGGTVQSVSENSFINDKGIEQVKDYTVALKTAENEIKKIRLVQTEDAKGNTQLKEYIQTVDDTGKAAEKTAQKFESMQKSITKDLQSISNSGKLTDEQIAEFQRTIASTDDVAGLQRIKTQLDAIRASSKIPDRGQILGYDKNNLKEIQQGLQKLDGETREHIQSVLQLQQEYKDLQVRAIQVDQVSGKWSATLRKNAKENLELKGSIDRTNGSIYKQSEAIKQASASNLGILEQFKIALSRVPVWIGAMTVFYGSIRSLEQMRDVVVEVDTAITNLRKVMDQDTNFNDMLDEAIVKARELGQTVTSVLESFQQGARAGLSAEDISFLSQASLIASNVGEIEAQQSADYLISAIEQMNLAYEDSMSIIDAWNNLANNNNVTVEALAQGIARSGSTMRLFGEDIHSTNSAVAVLSQVLKQSGNEIGNFLKSASPRLLMSDVQGTLEGLGISVRNAKGEMKAVLDVYQDVADAMDEGKISAEQFNEASLALGGRYHITRVQALIESMQSLNGEQSLYDKMLQDSVQSVGSATAENLTYMNSIEAQQRKLTASFQEYALSVGDASLTEGYRLLLDLLTSLADLGTSFTNNWGFLPPLFGTISTAVILLSGNVRKFIKNLKDSFINIMPQATANTNAQTTAIKGQTVATNTATTAVRGLGIAWKSALVSTGIGIGIVAVTSFLGKLAEDSLQASAKQRELEQQTQELTNSYKSNRTEIERLVAEYEKLNSITSRTAEQETRYLEVSNRLGELVPSIVESKDEEGNARLRNVEAINKEIGALNELSLIDAKTFIDNFTETEEEIKDRISSLKDDIDDLYDEQSESIWTSDRGMKAPADELTDPDLLRENLLLQRQQESTQRELNEAYLEFAQAIGTRDGITKALNDTQQEHIQKIIDEMGYTKEAQDAIELYVGTLARIAPEVRNAFSGDEVQNFTEDQISVVNKLAGVLVKQKDGVSDLESDIDKYSKALVDSGISSSQVKTIIDSMTKSIVDEEAALLATNEALEENAEAVDEVLEAYNNATSAIKDLNGVINELNEGHGVSADSVSMLMEKYPHLLQYLDDETALREAIMDTISKEEKVAIDALSNKLLAEKDFLEYVSNGNQDFYKWLGETYQGDLSNFKNLAQAKAAVENQLINEMSQKWGKFYSAQTQSFTDMGRAFLNTDTSGMGVMEREMWEINAGHLTRSVAGFQREMAGVRDRFNSIVADQISVNFGGIGLKSPSSGRGSSSSKKESDAARKAEEAQRRVLEVILAQIDAYKRKAEALNDDIAHEQYYASKYEETSHQYRQRQTNIAELMKKQSDYQKQTISYIEGQLKSNKRLNTEQRRELETTLVQTRQTYYSTLSAIDGINKEILQSYESIADKVVEIYKEAYEKQREIAIETNDNELRILEDSHNKKLRMLDEEMSAYERLIQAKIDSMDKEKESADYAETLAEKQKERLEIQRQIQILSLDDSLSARKQVRDLEEELRKKEKEITDFTVNRERELRKESLQEQLNDKREQIESERELENGRFEDQRHQLEMDRDIIEQYYEDLINDERNFAQIRQQILNDNTNNITNTIKQFSKDINNNMEIIGGSISRNLLDKLSEAQQLLAGIKFTSGSSIVNTPGGMPAGFASGGYTGNFSGGKLGILHEKELILNQNDTKNMLQSIHLVRNLVDKLPKLADIGKNKNPSISFNPTFSYLVQGQFDEGLAKKYTDYTMKEMKNGLQGLGVQFPR